MSKEFKKEQVFSFYQNAPKPVQEAFAAETTVDTILAIQATYGLHTDTAGMLGREIGYLLLGLTTPKDFYDRLHANGLPTDTVTSIVKDVNEKIFVPLQKKMREQGSETSVENVEPPAYTPPPIEPATPVRPESVPVMQVGESPIPAVPPVPVPAPAPTSTEVWSSGVVPSAPPIAPVVPPPAIPSFEEVSMQPVAPKFRTMASDMQSLASAGGKTQSMPPSQNIPQQTSPARSFQTSSVPATNSPINLPGQDAPVSAIFSSAPQIAPIPPAQAPSFRYSEPSVKPSNSSLDPYREPVQ